MTEQLMLHFTSDVKVGVSQLGIFFGSESFFFFFFEALQIFNIFYFILFWSIVD